MGMLLSVYRSSGSDCTNGGISANADNVVVVNVEGPFEPSEKNPAVVLVRKEFGFGSKIKLVPADENGQPKEGWFMNGGNAAGTSDSRWSRAIEEIAGVKLGMDIVDIFDRQES